MSEFSYVMFAYAADLDGAIVEFIFDDANGMEDSVFSDPLANTNNSSDIMADGVEVKLALPQGIVDYTQLTSVTIDINGVQNLDFTIDNVKLIPEPTTLALLGLGLAGLGWQRRRLRAG